MVDFEEAIRKDIEKYKQNDGFVSYPFNIEDFAIKVFRLDVQYDDFDLLIDKKEHDPRDFFGILFPETDPLSGFERVIYINTNRNPFKLGNFVVPKEYYIKDADRQTIAHEVGHYSDKYIHNKIKQESLFPELFVDDPTSIIVYPKEAEVFANKYARNLLIPEYELKQIINKNDLHGTIDLRENIKLFTDFFGVTQFLIEIRLNELNIHFNNGVYIKKLNKTKGSDYSEKELHVLLEIGKKYDFQVSYYDADSFVGLFNKITGGTRASGPLYMAYKRLMDGDYDSKYPELFDKRIKMLIEYEGEQIKKTNIIEFKKSAL